MTNHLESTKTWQAWLARLESLLRVELWEQFMARVGDENEMNLQRWAAMYTILLQTALSSAMLLACWEEPAEEVESTLEDIARRVGAMRFEKARRGMDRQLRDLYVESTKRLMRDLPSEADVLRAIFVAYVRDDYDSGKDANLLMREAQSLAAMRQREAALAAVGRAGAAGLRGSSIWPGWADEGSPEFCHWALVLTGALESYAPQLPFGPVAEERLHAEQRAQELKPLPFPQTNVEIETGEGEDEVEDEDENESLSPTPEFITEWMNIAQREQPLSPEEIVELGDRYDMYVEMAIRSLEMRDFLPPDMSATGLLSLTATVLGVLRCSDEHVIDLLMELIVKEDELAEDGDDDAPDAAIWALQQIGQPALQPIFDFVRYSSLEAARTSMLQVLGAVGRGSPEVYDYLAGQFTQTSWADDKSRYALPLALLHDPRAVPLFVEALKAPGVTEPIAWELLDALQELEVTFYINHDTRAVNIPDYGVIEDVLPSEWMSRAEIAQQEADVDKDLDEWEELDDEDEWDDEDDLGEDETDTYDDEVVYDAEGIPRCPDCGAEMHYIAGRWVHPPDVEPPAVKPIRTQHIGRNDPCPCGSGKKYKNCHGRGV